MNHTAIIIRFWHKNREHFKWRLQHFTARVLPLLRSQTMKNFDICVLADPQDHKRFKSLGIKPFTLNQDGYDYKKQGNFRHDQTVGLDRYSVQIRIDSDDFVSKDFVEQILYRHFNMADTVNKKTLVTVQPKLWLLKDGIEKTMKHRYRSDKPSMFMSIRQPVDSENYMGVYEKPFLRFGSWPDRAFIIPEFQNLCHMVIHDINTGSHSGS